MQASVPIRPRLTRRHSVALERAFNVENETGDRLLNAHTMDQDQVFIPNEPENNGAENHDIDLATNDAPLLHAAVDDVLIVERSSANVIDDIETNEADNIETEYMHDEQLAFYDSPMEGNVTDEEIEDVQENDINVANVSTRRSPEK